jgi:hypothetical protein
MVTSFRNMIIGNENYFAPVHLNGVRSADIGWSLGVYTCYLGLAVAMHTSGLARAEDDGAIWSHSGTIAYIVFGVSMLLLLGVVETGAEIRNGHLCAAVLRIVCFVCFYWGFTQVSNEVRSRDIPTPVQIALCIFVAFLGLFTRCRCNLRHVPHNVNLDANPEDLMLNLLETALLASVMILVDAFPCIEHCSKDSTFWGDHVHHYQIGPVFAKLASYGSHPDCVQALRDQIRVGPACITCITFATHSSASRTAWGWRCLCMGCLTTGQIVWEATTLMRRCCLLLQWLRFAQLSSSCYAVRVAWCRQPIHALNCSDAYGEAHPRVRG